MTIQTTSTRLKTAAELGRRLRAIRGEEALWSLSRDAWRRQCLELSGWSEPSDLLAADRRVAELPHLDHELTVLATLWASGGQDHPAPSPIFTQGDRFPSMYAEVLHSHLSPEQLSAVAALRCARIRDERGHPWGRADSLDDGPAALAPHLQELATLDRELATTIRLLDLHWVDGKPLLKIGVLVIPVGEDTARSVATAIAEAAALRPEQAEAA